MSRILLGIIGAILVITGIISLIGHSAGWTSFCEPVWYSWANILVGIISMVVAAADTNNK